MDRGRSPHPGPQGRRPAGLLRLVGHLPPLREVPRCKGRRRGLRRCDERPPDAGLPRNSGRGRKAGQLPRRYLLPPVVRHAHRPPQPRAGRQHGRHARQRGAHVVQPRRDGEPPACGLHGRNPDPRRGADLLCIQAVKTRERASAGAFPADAASLKSEKRHEQNEKNQDGRGGCRPHGPLLCAGAVAGRERQILALGRRQPLPGGAGADGSAFDDPPAHHQRQGRLHLRQGIHVRRGAAAAAGGLRPVRQRPGREPSPGAGQVGLRQIAVRQRVPRSGHRPRAHLSVALPPGRLALPRGPRLEARPAAPRLGGLPRRRGPHAAALPRLRSAGGRHAALDRPLQGLRTDVRTLRRAALHRGVQRLGDRLEDRPLEHLAPRQFVPAVGRDDARLVGGQRGRGRTHRAARGTEVRREPRAGDVRHPRRRRGRQFALHPHCRAERGRLAGAARTGRRRHRRGPFVVPDAERTGLRCGIQRRTHSARIRGGAQHGDPRRAGRADGADSRRHRLGAGAGHDVAANRQPSADPLETHLHEGLGGPQGRRTRLRPGR